MVAAYSLNNLRYEVDLAVDSDIDEAYDTVVNIVNDTDKQQYIDNMKRSLRQGYAYKLQYMDQVVAWIWLSKSNGVWYGDMFWGKNAILMSLLWRYVNTVTGDIRIRFMPHSDQLAAVKSLATGKSIRLMHNGKSYVVVDTKELREKCEQIHNKLGVICLQ